jgi:tight adherence protein B
MASSLECGLSAVQALDRMQAESPSPIAEEFAQVTRAIELGAPLHLALEEAAMRLNSGSFSSFAMIVSVQHRVGGDMATLLNTLAENLQERLEFKAELNALTAQARYSAWVLTALPFGVCGLVALANPGYMSPLIMTTTGRVMLAFAALLLLIGLLAVRVISRVDL